MSVTLRPATAEDRALIEALMQFYETGAFRPYPHLVDYFDAADRWPLLIFVEDHIAGFALINQHSHLTGGHVERNMGEFFVGRPFRRHGVATEAFHQVVALHPGAWEVAVAVRNAPARAFWSRAIAAAPNVSDVEQTEGDGEHWTGPIWTFRAT